jgi:2-methylcitrate dehydratase PrpD
VALLYGCELAWNVYDHIGDDDVAELCRIITVKGDPAFKQMQNRMRIQWKDGLVQEETLNEPLGEKTQPFRGENIKAKFMACVEPSYGKNRASEICQAVEKLEAVGIAKLMELIRYSP